MPNSRSRIAILAGASFAFLTSSEISVSPELACAGARASAALGARPWSSCSMGVPLAKISLDDAGLGQSLLRVTRGDRLAIVQHHHPVAQARDDIHVVLDHQNRGAVRL